MRFETNVIRQLVKRELTEICTNEVNILPPCSFNYKESTSLYGSISAILYLFLYCFSLALGGYVVVIQSLSHV